MSAFNKYEKKEMFKIDTKVFVGENNNNNNDLHDNSSFANNYGTSFFTSNPIEIISISSKDIFLFPQRGRAFFELINFFAVGPYLKLHALV